MNLTQPIPRACIPADTTSLSRYLLGKCVVNVGVDHSGSDQIVSLRIVETEGYPPGDPAAHHYKRMTHRNRSLFLDRGHAYVYKSYGISWMLNVSSETEGVGGGVLLRAGVPVAGLALIAQRRGAVAARDLARGPGRLAQALGVDDRFDGVDLCAPGRLYLADDGASVGEIGVGVRIGITRAADRALRFFLRDNRFVSGPAWLNRLEDSSHG